MKRRQYIGSGTKVRLKAPMRPINLTLEELLERYGKYCPKCHSGQVSSDNSTPTQHKCLDCGHKFPDSEAIIGRPAAKGRT